MTEIVSFPWELKVLLDWDKKDMLMIIEEDKPLREILNSICEQHDKDPQEFSVKAMTSEYPPLNQRTPNLPTLQPLMDIQVGRDPNYPV